jgi:ABC-2 type transport system ATP-binding protein
MIEATSLTRHYGRTTAVDGVSFEIGDNEIVGLLGHNGAGKTTIMRMLSGYLEPSAGSIRIGEVDVVESPHDMQRVLGYLPENLPIYPDMSVVDYLEYAATTRGIGSRDRMYAVCEALASTDLHGRALDRVSELSRGMRQRVGVAQAIIGQPKLLILDEPTNGLDPAQTAQMRELILRLARTATVVLSTHIMQEVDAVCDRVLVLREGRLALDSPLDALYASNVLVLQAGGDVEPLATYLARLPQVAAVSHTEQHGGLVHYELTLHEGADADTASNNVAQCVVGAGARLFRLEIARRDLDSVFREVTNGD